MSLNAVASQSHPNTIPYRVSIAPMMDYTDTHFRMFMRCITKHTWLYTEMISTGAILHGTRDIHLAYNEQEHPLVLQLGGDAPDDMGECAHIASEYGYDEVNINAGCPSDRVRQGAFGAVLMTDIARTVQIVESMVRRGRIPVSVKCRIGVDGTKFGLPVYDTYEYMHKFVQAMQKSGACRVTVHARIAVLGGLSPKENREIPPLRYADVYRLSDTLPDFPIEINGGVRSLKDVHTHLAHVDAVMLARAAVNHPEMFHEIDHVVQACDVPNDEPNDEPTASFDRVSVAMQYAEYLQRMYDTVNTAQRRFVVRGLRHMIPLWNGIAGARKWRQCLTDMIVQQRTPMYAVRDALKHVER